MLHHYDQPDTLELKNYIAKHFDAHREDIQRMIERETQEQIDALINFHDRNRTQKTFEDARLKALANIRRWISEPRKKPRPIDIACHRASSIYFLMIERKADN